MNNWIDITFPITDNSVTWPGDEKIQIVKSSEIGVDGAEANVTKISMSAHTGTHIDAPLHFIKDGEDIVSLNLSTLTGVANVIAIKNEKEITCSELEEHTLINSGKILFKTVNSQTDWINQPFNKHYVHLTTDAAQHLVKLGVKTVGIDYLSVGGLTNGTAVHRILLDAGITIIEGLNMKDVSPGVYELVALPIKIKGADGAPARVIIRRLQEEGRQK